MLVNKFLPVIALVVIVLLGLVLYNVNRMAPSQVTAPSTESPQPTTVQTFSFDPPKKSAHYESNTPAHGAILPAPPTNVVIDFNFDLGSGSAISIGKKQTDSEIGVGETIIDANKLALRRAIDGAAPDGIYVVAYKACWPDGSCHDGSFEFAIERSKVGEFTDQLGRKEVMVKLSQLAFVPQNIRVSRGTKITWINDDETTHYVNTDSHPAHTYLPAMNSKALAKGDSYSYTFNEAGFFPYHCSAHASVMTGGIVVE